MASASEGDTTLPPLILDRGQNATRLVVTATASSHARGLARSLSEAVAMDLLIVPEIDGIPQTPSAKSDLLFHGVPDAFGRILGEPTGWESVVVVDRICGRLAVASPWRIDVGDPPAYPVASVSDALARLDKHLRQQRRVRPLFSTPPALGLPYIAPDGVTLLGDFGRVEFPEIPGLPDLVVVRPSGDPSMVR